MSTPAATKRRRLNDASQTLHKPFKSPFRTPLSKPSAGATTSSLRTDTSATPGNSNEDEGTKVLSESRQRERRTPRIPFPAGTARKDSPISLNRELISLRSDIQVLTQAYSLVTSSTDKDLNVLVERWRAATRAAAEELFAGTRDRVNRMGGVGAWRDREREQREWRSQWDKEDMNPRRQGDEDVEKYAMDGDEPDPAAAKEEECGGAGNDDTFTMDMMLKTLNIDLDLIGYDREAQRWTD